ncbi:MAG: ParB/RepB/Spo0J family partition protein [Paracoccaceae bacterium]
MNDKKSEKRGLGRGLSALMADIEPYSAPSASDGQPFQFLPTGRIAPNPDQPRRDFSTDAIEGLAASIREKGVIQPLIVRPIKGGDTFQIVAGERRWRAAQLAGLHDLPVIIRDFDDAEVIEIAIIENIQRADLNAIEEALAYRQLIDRFGHTQEKLAQALSKSRSHVANLLRLLTLPDAVQALLRNGELTAGHARALITSAQPAKLAAQVIKGGLSVRETERLAKAGASDGVVKKTGKRFEKDADTRSIETDISANLKMLVRIDHNGPDDGGTMTIRYRTLDDLDLLCDVLSKIPRDMLHA